MLYDFCFMQDLAVLDIETEWGKFRGEHPTIHREPKCGMFSLKPLKGTVRVPLRVFPKHSDMRRVKHSDLRMKVEIQEDEKRIHGYSIVP